CSSITTSRCVEGALCGRAPAKQWECAKAARRSELDGLCLWRRAGRKSERRMMRKDGAIVVADEQVRLTRRRQRIARAHAVVDRAIRRWAAYRALRIDLGAQDVRSRSRRRVVFRVTGNEVAASIIQPDKQAFATQRALDDDVDIAVTIDVQSPDTERRFG